MNEDEYAILLQSVRQRATDAGRADLDASLVRSRVQDASSNRDAVLAYLYGLRDDFALRNERTLRETMRRLAQFPSENGSSVSGLVVDINEQDRAVFDGRAQVDLLELSEVSDAVIEIDGLIADIESDQAAE